MEILKKFEQRLDADLEKAQQQRIRASERAGGRLSHSSHLVYLDGLMAGLESARRSLLEICQQSEVLLPVGTRIKFLKSLYGAATGDTPACVYAEKGQGGVVTGHGTPEGHWVKWDNCQSAFGARYGLEFVEDSEQAAEQVELYFLQSANQGYIGNSPLFWSKGDSGYTQWLPDAKQMTYEETEHIMRSTHGTHHWKRWKVSEIMPLSRQTVDMQDMRKLTPQTSDNVV